jgi:two-component system, chemotaxis family, protein-glutamate methylesterase/glutaminase
MIKLLIVDDSALMRRQLTRLFEDQGDFQVRVARNGREAIDENAHFMPDVITLDINMPEMDGLTALSHLMADRPVPVVMVSSLTEKGALATFEALNLGAVDFVTKPGGTISLSMHEVEAEILAKVRSAAKARLRSAKPVARGGLGLKVQRTEPATALVRRATGAEGVILIGVSTGGPRTLEDILPLLPDTLPWPVLVAQHMPPSFTRPFAERMNGICPLEVSELSQPTPILPGHIYIGKGGSDMVLVRRAGRLMATPKPENREMLWHPSVELLGRSALEHCDPACVIGVMLTGMGNDGAESFAELKRKGARTIAESEQTAVVFGMPAELIARQGASVVLPCDRIAQQIINWATR